MRDKKGRYRACVARHSSDASCTASHAVRISSGKIAEAEAAAADEVRTAAEVTTDERRDDDDDDDGEMEAGASVVLPHTTAARDVHCVHRSTRMPRCSLTTLDDDERWMRTRWKDEEHDMAMVHERCGESECDMRLRRLFFH